MRQGGKFKNCYPLRVRLIPVKSCQKLSPAQARAAQWQPHALPCLRCLCCYATLPLLKTTRAC